MIGVLVPSQKTNLQVDSSHQGLLKSSGERDSLTVPSHPLKIRPVGNAYTATKNIKLAAGYLAFLPDEILVQVLEYLDGASLKQLGCACKALYAFSRIEDLWKTLCIEYEHPHPFLFASRCHNIHFEPCDPDFQRFCCFLPHLLAQEANLFRLGTTYP